MKCKNPLNDQDIRNALTQEISKSQQKAKIIYELHIDYGAVRADVVALKQETISGYEIKSDKDNLTRLKRQIDAYNRVFDKITLVVGKRHIIECVDIVPEWWGIQIAMKEQDDKLHIYSIRKPEKNKQQKNISIARLLWRQEALDILKEQKKDKGVRSKPREHIYERMSTVLSPHEIKNKTTSTLYFRRDWRPNLQLV